jgi:hypothetical protein
MDPDPAQNLNAYPDPRCQLNADKCGSRSETLLTIINRPFQYRNIWFYNLAPILRISKYTEINHPEEY